MLGFCDDYTKVIYGMKHTLEFVWRIKDEAIFRALGADAVATAALVGSLLVCATC